MLQSMAQIRRDGPSPDALFITLTYPAWYPSSVRRCKQHLAAWQRRVKRRHPRAWFYWKLEFQVRGAPHFHMLMFGAGTVTESWFHDIWYEIVDSREHFHWFYGTRVDRLHSWKEAGAYCAKYCAKVDTPNVCDSPGRFWGIANRKLRPVDLVEAELTDGEFYALRRVITRYMGKRHGFHGKGGPTSGVWTRLSEAGAKRLLVWAIDRAPADPYSLPPPASSPDSVYGGPGIDTSRSSTPYSLAAKRSSPDRTPCSTNQALFDQADLARRRAARLLA